MKMFDIKINKDKNIGQVIFVVEGQKTEPNILWNIFANILDYQCETIIREKKYRVYNKKDNPYSRVIVINSEESNISKINNNQYLDDVFTSLINDYQIDVDNSAIYYIFDMDIDSNNIDITKDLISKLKNSRENDDYYMQGMLLLSYPAIESFILSNFDNESFAKYFAQGKIMKQYLHEEKFNYQKINENTLKNAVLQMLLCFEKLKIKSYDIDNFYETNRYIFEEQNNIYSNQKEYLALSLICIALIDLQIIQVD